MTPGGGVRFNMTRVINLFRRADQVDDIFQESEAKNFDVTGETAKGRRPRARTARVLRVPRLARLQPRIQ
jgi:hypothetical protein